MPAPNRRRHYGRAFDVSLLLQPLESASQGAAAYKFPCVWWRGWPEQFAETAAWQENVRRAHFSVPQELEHI